MNREKLEKLNQAIAKMKALIPPEIKLRKELSLEGIWLYIFRHDKLGCKSPSGPKMTYNQIRRHRTNVISGIL